MARYVILRRGSNAANQSGLQEMILGMIDAPSNKVAKAELDDFPREGWFHCYNNQYLEVMSFSAYRKREGLSAEELDQYVYEAERAESEYAKFQQDMERLHQ